jgi:hypothetical protein
MTVAIVASRLHQSLNFALGEVFAGAIVGVRQPTPGNCSLFDGWCFGSRCWFHCAISPFQATTVPIMVILRAVQIDHQLKRRLALRLQPRIHSHLPM